MGYQILQGNTVEPLRFLMVLASDHITGATGLTPTVVVRKPGGGWAAPAGAVSEAGYGWYEVAPSAADADTLGALLLHATSAGADPCDETYDVVAAPVTPTIAPPTTPVGAVTVTASGLIGQALQMLGVFGVGQTLSPEQLSNGLIALNRMIDGWATQRLTVPVLERVTRVLTSGLPSVTIGPTGADVTRAVPLWIPCAGVEDLTASPPIEIPVTVLSEQRWQQHPVKTQTGTSIEAVYLSRGASLGTVFIFPVPSVSTLRLVLYLQTPLGRFADATTIYTLPIGYERALVFNLAVEVAPSYGVEPAATILRIAATSLGDLKRVNSQVPELTLDPAIVGRGSGRWDIFSGGYR